MKRKKNLSAYVMKIVSFASVRNEELDSPRCCSIFLALFPKQRLGHLQGHETLFTFYQNLVYFIILNQYKCVVVLATRTKTQSQSSIIQKFKCNL